MNFSIYSDINTIYYTLEQLRLEMAASIGSLNSLTENIQDSRDVVYSTENGVRITNMETVNGEYILFESPEHLSINSDNTFEFNSDSTNSVFISTSNRILIYTTFTNTIEDGWYVFRFDTPYTLYITDLADLTDLLYIEDRVIISKTSLTRAQLAFPNSESVVYF
jgi:hypothetical protein